MRDTLTIWVDGDACPVKEIIMAVGMRYHMRVVIISSIAHFTLNQDARAQWQFVDSSYQGVDIKLLNQVQPQDIVITQDYGLAALLIEKGCQVLHHNGFLYTKENIDELLMKRHFNAKMRKAGGRIKGPKPIKEADRKQFERLLTKVVEEYLQE